jgi:hypothetical protein
MTTGKRSLLLVTSAASTLFALAVEPAMAGSRIFDNTVSSTTIINGSSLTLPGTVTNPASNNDPFEIQVYARAGECIRLEVTSSLQGVDLETVVRAPNGSIYRNDDGSGGGVFANPLVKINNAPNTGWYSVSINHWFGTASYADFVLLYGRYSLNNVNCSVPTGPVSASQVESAAQKVDAPARLTPGVGTVSK